MGTEDERIEEFDPTEGAEAVLPLQETPAEEPSDVAAHASATSVALCVVDDV